VAKGVHRRQPVIYTAPRCSTPSAACGGGESAIESKEEAGMHGATTFVLHYGKIVTADRHGPIAEAVAIADGTILHVGQSV
jgi:hypothetical protein